MNYDTTISQDVSLSKVLDEMIVDGTDFELIVQFLKEHESSIKDIYAHSAFVYELYDLVENPFRIDGFLAHHIMDLPAPYRYYYLATHMKFGLGNFDLECKYNYSYFHELLKKNPIDDSILGNRHITRLRGFYNDADILIGDVDMVAYLNKLSANNDQMEMKRFIGNSYLIGNVLTAKLFNRLNLDTRFLILTLIKSQFKEEFLRTRKLGYTSHSISDGEFAIMGLMSILLKQLVYLNEIDEFNWVVNVLELSELHNANGVIGQMMMLKLPESIRHDINTNAEFSEVVFDMNLVETQFDVLDLFLYIYIYIANPRLRGQMMEAIDLVDFFNLGFDWKELEFIKKAGV